MDKYPGQGISAPSFGKYDEFREWLSGKIGIGNWQQDSYATGAGTTAHNFGSRWSQSNQVSGRHVPLGIGFVHVREADPTKIDAAVKTVLDSVKDTSTKFVDGTRPTSYEAMIIFSQLNGARSVEPRTILATTSSAVGSKLRGLFPGAEYVEVKRAKPLPQPAGSPAPVAPARAVLPLPAHSLPVDATMVAAASDAFVAAGYVCDPELIRRAIASLASKPFLILAGQTGSGKTQLARALARWLTASDDQREVIAVGADWTSSQNLLGYADALQADRYASTAALELILRASANPKLPFFLILDEMNLSHVERYFSDFLSGLESRESIKLHGKPEDPPRNGVPPSIAIPRNLFVIGTVNVNETTYMFSPKVLDRANVIEFHVERAAMDAFLRDSRAPDFDLLDGKGDAYAQALVDAVTVEENALTEDEQARAREELLLFFDVFASQGVPFAFRTARDITRYLGFYKALSAENWSFAKALDCQVLQRLMPKLQGERRRLKPILLALGHLCDAQHLWDQGLTNAETLRKDCARGAGSLDDAPPAAWKAHLSASPPSAALQLSLRKVIRMLEQLQRDGYTSFIEA